MARVSKRHNAKANVKVSRKQKNPYNISFAGCHPLVEKSWDKKKTLLQNYANLGLTPALNGSAGGIESSLPTHIPIRQKGWLEQDVEQKQQPNEKEALMLKGAIARGAISFRLEDGTEHVLQGDILVPKAEFDLKQIDTLDENKSKINSDGLCIGTRLGQSAPVSLISVNTEIKDAFVKALKEDAAKGTPNVRHTSEQELSILGSLLRKHGLDYTRMVKDHKLNQYQFSVGQLKKKFASLAKNLNVDISKLTM